MTPKAKTSLTKKFVSKAKPTTKPKTHNLVQTKKVANASKKIVKKPVLAKNVKNSKNIKKPKPVQHVQLKATGDSILRNKNKKMKGLKNKINDIESGVSAKINQ